MAHENVAVRLSFTSASEAVYVQVISSCVVGAVGDKLTADTTGSEFAIVIEVSAN